MAGQAAAAVTQRAGETGTTNTGLQLLKCCSDGVYSSVDLWRVHRDPFQGHEMAVLAPAHRA